MEKERLAAKWLGRRAHPLATLDPKGPLDDLEPLRPLVQGARVVAIGENAHFIEEFSSLRQRILRFLVERCGFRGLAFEAGLEAAGIGSALVDLQTQASRAVPDAASHAGASAPVLDRIRMQSTHIELPVRASFDAVLNVAETRVSPSALGQLGRWSGSDM